MSYNKYNTRHSGRYNAPGQFVASSELAQEEMQPLGNNRVPPPPRPPLLLGAYGNNHYGQPPNRQQMQPQQQQMHQQQQQQQMHQQQQQQEMHQQEEENLQHLETPDMDMEMKAESTMETNTSGDETNRHPWKSRLTGVKKISKKERRRRQNLNLRRLLTPKNALMVLNEMMPNEQVASQFKVETASTQGSYYKSPHVHNFCAALTLDGVSYKGYGENKLLARNAAAEQAIRDLIIKRMAKAASAEGSMNAGLPSAGEDAEGNGAGGPGTDEETLPMIQLASFALHKLFSEWEYGGHKVPQLKPITTPVTEAGGESAAVLAAAAAAPVEKKPRELPATASTMHPSMLLSYMRPNLEYRELSIDGDKPQNMIFTMGVDVDGTTYVGKATNKKEARKQAAKSACLALFNVQFEDVAKAGIPVPMQQQQ